MKRLKISDKKNQILNQLNIYSIQDLMQYYPFRYEENKWIHPKEWQLKQRVCFEANIVSKITNRYIQKRSMQTAKVQAGNELIEILLFNQPWFTTNKIGATLTFFGVVQAKNKVLITSYNQIPLELQLGIKPIYYKKQGINNKDIINYIKKAIALNEFEVWMPQYLITKYKLIDKKQAIENIHFPKSKYLLTQSIRYLKFEEFLKFQLCIQQIAQNTKTLLKKRKRLNDIDLYINQLPFELSQDQKQAIIDIREDFIKEICMYRLLQGDVGSGKTIVAFLSMLSVQTQAALLAPTEILATQHYNNFKKINQNVVLLTSSLTTKQKQVIYDKIMNNEVQYIIGTHAILQEKIIFHNLGFVVIDEQQRFGVNQRKALLNKGKEIDVLIMSATPIPRTMALTLYNDQAISTIKTLPKAKKMIHSYLIETNKINSILKEIENKIFENEQVYIVCSAIEKNENYQARNVYDVYESFVKVAKNKYTIGLLHGKLKQEEKEAIMQAFLNKEIQVLVTTTVIEVGVDVKDANVMVVYDAHRFGLSQLHQLRGRCARGDREGYCYFLTDSKDEQVLEKLKVLVKINDGFKIAEEDLKLRGPGDMLGVRQSGIPNFVLGDVIEDQNYMEVAKSEAIAILDNIQNYPYISQNILSKINQYID